MVIQCQKFPSSIYCLILSGALVLDGAILAVYLDFTFSEGVDDVNGTVWCTENHSYEQRHDIKKVWQSVYKEFIKIFNQSSVLCFAQQFR